MLNVTPSGTSDRYCTILTDQLGVVGAYAKGARSMKNKNFAATEQFVYGRFELFANKGHYSLDESDGEEMHLGLRNDIVSLATGQYLCQLAMEFAPREEPAEECLAVMRGAFFYLSGHKRPPSQIKAAAEMRLLSLAGYMPDLTGCRCCGASERDGMFFLPDEGALQCGTCTPPGSRTGLPVSRGALASMRHVILSEAREMYAFTVGGESLAQFGRAAEAFSVIHTEKKLKTLAFLHSLM